MRDFLLENKADEELGAVPDALRTRLESETDDERLSRLIKMAARAKDIPEFIENYDRI